jgi:hypothetical protein
VIKSVLFDLTFHVKPLSHSVQTSSVVGTLSIIQSITGLLSFVASLVFSKVNEFVFITLRLNKVMNTKESFNCQASCHTLG